MLVRRLIFVRSPRNASLVKIYAALVSLVVSSLTGLAYALWPQGSPASPSRPTANRVAPAVGSPESGGQGLPRRASPAPGRGRWA